MLGFVGNRSWVYQLRIDGRFQRWRKWTFVALHLILFVTPATNPGRRADVDEPQLQTGATDERRQHHRPRRLGAGLRRPGLRRRGDRAEEAVGQPARLRRLLGHDGEVTRHASPGPPRPRAHLPRAVRARR